MPNQAPVPMLSPGGWTTSPGEKADGLFSHFFEAMKSQSALYGENVTSVQWIVEKYGHDIIAVTQNLQFALEKYLGRYYDSVTVTVSNDSNATNLKGDVTLSIHATVAAEGKQVSIGRLMQVNNSKILKIIAINNQG